jgi:hypothetical protein
MAGVYGRVTLLAKGIWNNQSKALAQVALFAYLPALLIVAVTALQPGIPPRVLFEDPAGLVQVPFYVGLLSNTGAAIWAATAAICLFTSAVLKRAGGDRRLARFFLASGLLTGYMMWDDLIMFHERLFPVYLSITEGVPKAILLVAILAFLFFHRATILRSQYALLGLSLAFLGLSFTVDVSSIQDLMRQYTPIGVQSSYLIEDGSKLVGIVGWFAYFILFAGDVLTARLTVGATMLGDDTGNGVRGQLQQDQEKPVSL